MNQHFKDSIRDKRKAEALKRWVLSFTASALYTKEETTVLIGARWLWFLGCQNPHTGQHLNHKLFNDGKQVKNSEINPRKLQIRCTFQHAKMKYQATNTRKVRFSFPSNEYYSHKYQIHLHVKIQKNKKISVEFCCI